VNKLGNDAEMFKGKWKELTSAFQAGSARLRLRGLPERMAIPTMLSSI